MTAHAGAEGPEEAHDGRRHHRGGRLVFLIGVALLVANLVTVAVLWVRRRHIESRTRSARTNVQEQGPRLSVVRVEVTAGDRSLTLPADTRAFALASINAKVGGYVREIRAERGQPVKRDQVLAVIEAPETRQDVEAARSDAENKRRLAARARALAPGVVSQQDLDNAINDERVALANFRRAASQRGYTELRAPFDGVVIARYVDPGAFLPSGTAASPIVDVGTLDRLRIFVYVAQDAAPFVHPGDSVTLWQDELPNKRIPAQVTYVAGALDPRTRTMQCEIDLDNRPWGVLPGTFLHVTMQLHVPPSPAVLNEAIVVRDGKTKVALVEGTKVRFVDVELGLNDGRTTRITHGLQGGETIGVNVPVEVADGAVVRPAPYRGT
ncbi:MAG: efflux transporter, family, subunit [Labilithrix sp.]|nr:efflux transporter, family, subunit [Labilithrix sp.]